MIVDTHTHLWAGSHLGEPFRSEIRGSGGARVEVTSEPTDHLVGTSAADVIFVLGFSASHIGVVVPNDYIADYVRQHPHRLIGYASVDPIRSDALEEFERATRDLGLKGLKLAPAYQNCHPLDDRLMRLYQRAEELAIPVTIHMGTTPHPSAPLEFGRPIHVDEIARSFPNLRLVIAHVAHPWEPEALVVIRKHPNIYADISALVYRPFQLYHTLRLAQEYAVTEKLLLG